uniref:dockerin type I domain-containing protein n=1 Tax=Salmonella sp. SAL4432 TaxID=3159887 RepID=UPI0039784251
VVDGAAAPCPGDLNNDALVDDADFVIFVNAYNILDCQDPAMPSGCPADLNQDGFVDDADFVIFVAAYNELICP